MFLSKIFADKLKEMRAKSGLTQQQLADMVGDKVNKTFSKQTIASYEQGRRDVSTDVLSAIADVLNTSADVLLGRADINAGIQNSEDEVEEEEEVEILTTWVRAQKRLSPEERKKFLNMIRAGFPELFEEKE